MKITGIISSANPRGNSATLLREILAGAGDGGAETEEIFLAGMNLEFCTGCLRCMADGRCFRKDGFEELRRKLEKSDGIVLSTPVFGGAPCAMLKNLIDRLGLFEYMTSSVFRGKYFAAVATAKTNGAERTVSYLAGLARNGVFGRAWVTGTIPAVLRGTKPASEHPELLRKARGLGAKMVSDFERRGTYPMQGMPARLIMDSFVRPLLAKSIVEFRDRGMGGVYRNLSERGLLPNFR